MFEWMLLITGIMIVVAMVVAYDGSRDIFHPLMFIGPMLLFLYAWMPYRLLQNDGLSRFFDSLQLTHVQMLNILGIAAFVFGCLIVGLRHRQPALNHEHLSEITPRRLLTGAALTGGIGLICWTITIINVGGFVNAFSASYAGGWDDSGYVRDGSLLLLVGVLLAISSLTADGPKLPGFIALVGFGLPWLASALLMGRRGPTFALVVVVLMGWYMQKRRRPPVIAMGIAAFVLAWFVLFLVTNRSSIYLGSDFDVKTDVSAVADKPDTGNEFIYGTGTVLSTERRGHYFWMRRYLAQVLVRPIPSAVWPTKYEDFGVPELLHNAGTGEGFGDALGWVGAAGSAPGIIADLWVEVWWLAVPLMALIGMVYGLAWQKAETSGAWTCQYVLLSALSIYLVMQTMEAVIFRTLLLSVPCWLVWHWAVKLSDNAEQPGVQFSSPSMNMKEAHLAKGL